MSNGDMPVSPVFDADGVMIDGLPDQQCTSGLTKREELAARAMQGFCALDTPSTPEQAAYVAVRYADALLAELEKDQ